jgi:hypothetical protein
MPRFSSRARKIFPQSAAGGIAGVIAATDAVTAAQSSAARLFPAGDHFSLRKMKMKRLILALALAAVAVSGCAQFKEGAYGGASAVEEQSPFPKYPTNVAG